MISTLLSVGGRGGAPLSRRAGQWLIAIEVTLALVLMSGSGPDSPQLRQARLRGPGFDAANVLTLEVEPLDQSAASDVSTTLHSLMPFGGFRRWRLLARSINSACWGADVRVPQGGYGGHVEGPQRTVLPGYFRGDGRTPARGTSARRGGSRDWRRDRRQRRLVAATLRWQRDRSHARTRDSKRQWRIIGVVPNIRHSGPVGGDGPEMYVLPNPRDTGPHR